MLQRSPVGWIAENRLLAGLIAISLLATLVGVAAVVSDGGDETASALRNRGGSGSGSASEITDGSGDTDAGTASGDPGGVAPGTRGASRGTLAGGSGGGSVIPGTRAAPPCTPKKVDATGITDTEITIGQIVTDVNQLPQQLRPAHEGLRAYLELVNAAGGVCGRTIKLEYRNDQLNPATHRSDYESLARRVFAFVANESLLESQDYSQDPPFDPIYTDGGEPVPDVGGLAFSYGRSQSNWHAGVVGSISPTLVGGGQFGFYAREARSRGTPCRTGGLVYLNEPTGASRDQAELGRVAAEQSWGAGLGAGNTEMYSANLADPVPVYEVLVDRMIEDGVNCVFSYTDLGSSVNLTRAAANRGVWPPDRCATASRCLQVLYVPLSAYDTKFVQDAGAASRGVVTFIPHQPLDEASHPAMRAYLDALKRIQDATPSTFSIFGFASGQMFVEALQACGGAPTRACVMDHLRAMEGFDSGGLLGAVTPFQRTRATFGRYGTFDWKHIFDCTVAMRVESRGGTLAFARANPKDSFFCDTIKVARGTPS